MFLLPLSRSPTTSLSRARFPVGCLRLTCRGKHFGRPRVPKLKNEPFKHFVPGSLERTQLRQAVDELRGGAIADIPCIVNGKEIFTGDKSVQKIPHFHKSNICTYHRADSKLIEEAVVGSLKAKHEWEGLHYADRAAVFLKAADLLSGKYRAKLLASTMVGQSKNVWQAEIDAGVELIDFWRYMALYAEQIYDMQPPENDFGMWNTQEYRPLEGFISAISPFNFTAIGGNLVSSPAIMGNVVVWKPSDNAIHSNYLVYKILEEAGLPPGVIQFLPSDPNVFTKVTMASPQFAGLHFTGSTQVFKDLWRKMASSFDNYKSYPRMCGETGGKNFHLVHPSADVSSVINNTIRGAFEYQGQKCSATSRLYAPRSLWKEIKAGLLDRVASIKMGHVEDFSVFMGAVIHDRSFDRAKGFIDRARASSDCTIIASGECSNASGYFIAPTIIETTNPHYESIRDEIFAPILTVYVYNDSDFDQVVDLCDSTSSYALTGALFARDRYVIADAAHRLRNAAGNFYINDKSTGSMVAQQPFGGGRMSGTNDKSGSSLNLLRWCSARATKEMFVPLVDYRYPSMSTLQ